MILTAKVNHDEAKNYPNEMLDAVLTYAEYVIDLFEELKAKDPNTLKEHEVKVNFAKYVPEGFGTADTILIADGVIHVIDFKYGQGVKVSATDNDQMKCYAIGALEEYDFIYSLNTVVMHIVQPRINNISKSEIDAKDLKTWALSLKKEAKLAFSGEGDAYPGEHCQFCRVRSICRARANLVEKLAMDGKDFKLLSDEEMVKLWPLLDTTEKFIKNVKDYVLNELLKGNKIKGFKLVEGRSLSRYSDELAVTEALKQAGYEEPVFVKKSLIGLTEMKKLLGAKKYREILEDNGLIVKPQGAPKVALATDEGKEIESDVSLDEFETLA